MSRHPALRILRVGEDDSVQSVKDIVVRYMRELQREYSRTPDRRLAVADIALLLPSAANAGSLAWQLSARGLAVTARGGALFAAHPILRQYLCALRAIADRDDGVAHAALLASPFFAIDPADVLASIIVKDQSDPQRARVRAARDVVEKIRQRRHLQSPGATARDLIENTGIGRALAIRSDAVVVLDVLYEMADYLDAYATAQSLDFDALVEACREWADQGLPSRLSYPRQGALHLLLAGDDPDPLYRVVFVVDDNGDLVRAASAFAEEIVVAVAPRRTADDWQGVTNAFSSIAEVTIGGRSEPGDWPQRDPTAARRVLASNSNLQSFIDSEAEQFVARVSSPTARTAVPAFAVLLGARPEVEFDDCLEVERAQKVAGSRFGEHYGRVVRRALQLVILGIVDDEREAVRQATAGEELLVNSDALMGDVQRALEAVRRLTGSSDCRLPGAFEVPLAMERSDGTLLQGVIDLLAVVGDDIVAIEIRSDETTRGALGKVQRRCAEQLRLYGEMLRANGLADGKRLRLGVLMTATGETRWM